MKNEIPIIENPMLFDRVIAEIQKGLKDNLLWLDHSFGKAQRITKQINGKTYMFPAVYMGMGNEYRDVSPDSNLGNFCFFVLSEPQTIGWIPNQQGSMSTPFSIIFWFDIRKVYPLKYNERNIDSIKAEILKSLNLKIKTTTGNYSFNKVWELSENIYKEYRGILELDNQFLMHPYGGLRFDGILNITEDC